MPIYGRQRVVISRGAVHAASQRVPAAAEDIGLGVVVAGATSVVVAGAQTVR